jgi:hypothetical protein
MIWDLIDRNWLYFYTAAAEVAERLNLSVGKAQRMLREACASGDIRSKQLVQRSGEWVAEPTKPSEWAIDEIDIEQHRRQRVADTEMRWYDLDIEKLPDNIREAWEKLQETSRGLEATGAALGSLHLGVGPVNVYVNGDDFQHWLDNLRPVPQPKSPGGKVPLIIDHLRSMFPKGGVPDASHCPRKQLRADLVKRDKRLEPLDDATLKSAIDAFNRSIRNDPK